MNKSITYYASRNQAYEIYLREAHKVSLKGLFKGKGELENLLREMSVVRLQLMVAQQKLIKGAQQYPVKFLPLLLKEGKARSGASFIRWRNQENDKSGLPAFREIMQNQTVPESAKAVLRDIEFDRIVFNMQMSIVTTFIRQLRECIEKINQTEGI